MNQMQYDLLKLAGAALLVEVANDPNQHPEISKQASYMLENISYLPQHQIGEELVKVAAENFSEDQLLAAADGHLYGQSIEKVAGLIHLNELDVETLEKVASEAGSSPTAVKGVAHELSDAAGRVEAAIEEAKQEAEGRPGGSVRAGGENVNNLEAMPLVTNEEDYIENTASHEVEQAYLTKHAAEEAYEAALHVLAKYNLQ